MYIYTIEHDARGYRVDGKPAGATVSDARQLLPGYIPRRLVATACSYAKERTPAPVTLHFGQTGWFLR